MLGIYNYTVILTCIVMLVSFTGVTFALGGDLPAALLVMAAAFLTPFRLHKPQLPGKSAMPLHGAAEFAMLLTRAGV